jgi:hypothetical protein
MKSILISLILLPAILISKENIKDKNHLRMELQIWEIKHLIEHFQDKLTDVEYFELMCHISILENLIKLD